MSVICDTQIISFANQGLVTPFDKELVNPASIDCLVGNYIMMETARKKNSTLDITGCDKNNPYMMAPGEFVLASTAEYWKLPVSLCATFFVKSSRAREGYALISGWIDPGFEGNITIELSNNSQFHRIPIYPGLKLGQMVFYTMDKNPEEGYNGRYQGQDKVTASRA